MAVVFVGSFESADSVVTSDPADVDVVLHVSTDVVSDGESFSEWQEGNGCVRSCSAIVSLACAEGDLDGCSTHMVLKVGKVEESGRANGVEGEIGVRRRGD